MAQNVQNAQTATPAAAGIDGLVSNPNKDKKASDPLFGPNIGPCSAGPAWTTIASRKKLITDDLTPEVLTGWVEKSKQSTQPTTTLQALVNLKRPSLRLSPLNSVPEDSQSPVEVRHQHLHGLEFEYDCDAPKCGIYVHVVLSKTHPEAASVPSASNQAQILVFETVTSGGFAKRLTLDEGALLELGRYDHTPVSHPAEDHQAKSDSTPEEATATSSGAGAGGNGDAAGTNTANRSNRRNRFTHFHFRKRSTNRSVAGPALAVVDADPQPGAAQDSGPAKKETKDNNNNKEEEEGVRVIIRLAALDEQGTELASPNEQTTFLHIVRLGAKPTEQPSAPSGEDAAEVDDHRPWVVKVVKREATIGPHTFQLHEIYGLTSSAHTQPASTVTSSPIADNDNGTAHTYPPQAAAVAGVTEEDDPSSECLLCLSSPREVVLIPCRHLVACKECALNMVEFGAGGQITHTPEPAVPAPAVVASANATEGNASAGTDGAAPTSPTTPGQSTSGTTAAAPNISAAVPTATTTRRKRKAKGWFCPVCRQPYTSLLRISAAAPPPMEKERASMEDPQSPQQPSGTIVATANDAANDASGQNGTNETSERPGGLLGGAFTRPSFLRGFTRGSNHSSTATPGIAVPGDVESRAGLGRVGA